MSSDERFRNKHIIITGAGGNFGRAGCLFFASRGAKVIALDKNKAALDETVTLVRSDDTNGGAIECFECDVTSVSSIEAALDFAEGKFGTPELLWNNAGYQGEIKPTLEYSTDDFATVMNVNVTGMFCMLQAVAKRMVKAQDPTKFKFSIVNTASVAGMRGTPAMVAYSSSKAAVLAMTVSSAKDLAPHNIRVNAVSPALIGPGFMWDRQNNLHASSGSPYFARDPEQVAKGKVNSVPMKRLGTNEEVIKSVAFLLSDDSSYTTAFNLVVDGGMSGGLR